MPGESGHESAVPAGCRRLGPTPARRRLPQPLPDADDGTLSGTRLWRVRAGYVEYLALRPNGLAHAVRAEARFDYRHPTEHGRIVEHRSGHAVNALDWLLTTSNPHASSWRRPYVAAPPGWPTDDADGR